MDATTMTQTNSLKQLAEYGQSPWLDYIRRDLFTTGELKRLIDEDGIDGRPGPRTAEKQDVGLARLPFGAVQHQGSLREAGHREAVVEEQPAAELQQEEESEQPRE